MLKTVWICLSLLIPSALPAQDLPGPDTSWNQTDNEGRKQGYWKKHYPDTTLRYVGYFLNGVPAGQFSRYYENGKLMAVMNHDSIGIRATAKLYYQNSNLAATGFYYQQVKDSTWNYFSYYTGARMYTEKYSRGKKEGQSMIYYPSGALAETQNFADNLREGKCIQYYEDSTLRQVTGYLHGNLHGEYILYDIHGTRLIEGNYLQGSMDGSWYFYNEKGQLEYQLRYSNGINLDEEEYRKKALEFMKELEDNIGKIPEPDINDFIRQQ
jgi:antitoxin component YwqK of YwqJK toxin-antitoxin module